MLTRTTRAVFVYPGDLFTMKHAHPWSGPCAACGRRNPRRFVQDATTGKKKLVTCDAHREVSGTERYETLCRVTSVHEGGFEYAVVAVRGLEDPLPTNPRGACAGGSGGMVFSWFVRQKSLGEIYDHHFGACDEDCRGCAECYQKTGETLCSTTCEHGVAAWQEA